MSDRRRLAATPALLVGAVWLHLALVSAQGLRFSEVGVIPAAAEMVEVSGGRAYAVLSRTLTVYDISNPAAPARVGAHTFPDKIWGITVVGETVYAAVDKYGLGILDVSRGAPVLRGSFKTPGQAKSVAIVGTRAILADHMSGVDFVDISNLAKPVSIGSFFLEGYARAVSAIGPVVAAVDSPTGIYVFDFSKPGALEPVGVEQTADRPGTVELADAARTGRPDLAVLAGNGTVQIFDVSNPAAPVKAATVRTPGGRPQRVAVRGRLVYVADGVEGLQVLDLTVPSKPRTVATFKTPQPARDVAVSDSLVLVAVGRAPASESAQPEGGQIAILRQSAG
jgi:hypothetical protein